LETARRFLDVEVVFLTHMDEGSEFFMIGAGDTQTFGPITEGASLALSESYCDRVVRECLPNVIEDAVSHPEVSDLDVTRAAGIGSYVGIPVHLEDGELYGTFCCLSHSPQNPLTEAQAEVMNLLAAMAAREISRAGGSRRVLMVNQRVTRALAASTSQSHVLEEVAAALGESLGCDGTVVWVGETVESLERVAAWAGRTAHGGGDEPSEVAKRAFSTTWPAQDPYPRSLERGPVAAAVPIAMEGSPAAGVFELDAPSEPLDEALTAALRDVGARIAGFLHGPTDSAEPDPLTPKELEVLEFAATGYSVEEVARSMFLSPTTVRTHLRSIYSKLGVPNRAGAVAQGIRRKLIT
jgi:DNA-binding CsgD family transcriptional regulator